MHQIKKTKGKCSRKNMAECNKAIISVNRMMNYLHKMTPIYTVYSKWKTS